MTGQRHSFYLQRYKNKLPDRKLQATLTHSHNVG